MARRTVPITQSALVRRFGDRLRELRLAAGMTQADLSRKATVTPAYLSRLEGGKIAPGIDMVERLAEVLGAAVHDLLPGGPVPDPLPALKEQARGLMDALLAEGDRDTFRRLNPFLALLVEAAGKRPLDKQK